jgi:hypothetical protein
MIIADAERLREGGSTLVKKYGKVNPKMSIVLIRDGNNINKYHLQDELAADLNIMKPIDVNIVLKQVSEILMNRR